MEEIPFSSIGSTEVFRIEKEKDVCREENGREVGGMAVFVVVVRRHGRGILMLRKELLARNSESGDEMSFWDAEGGVLVEERR